MAKRVMIVEDNKDDLETMKEIIEEGGYETITFDNGKDALNELINNKVDLILIDIKMPGLTGYDLLRLAREKINHDSKMVFVSIIPKKEVVLDNVDGFIQKPFSPEVFLSQIKDILN